jgi:hypothetical protein
MLVKTNHAVLLQQIQQALDNLPAVESRYSLNESSGDFFYDTWHLKSEFRNTIWEELYESLPENKGEARIIKLVPGETYLAHADIDDRWHLNLSGSNSFLIEVNSKTMHSVITDGQWYDMDASIIHSAINLGSIDRLQLVVRHLLVRGRVDDSISITITPSHFQTDYRFKFDNIISPWLNQKNKQGVLDKFNFIGETVSFNLSEMHVEELKHIATDNFQIDYS